MVGDGEVEELGFAGRSFLLQLHPLFPHLKHSVMIGPEGDELTGKLETNEGGHAGGKEVINEVFMLLNIVPVAWIGSRQHAAPDDPVAEIGWAAPGRWVSSHIIRSDGQHVARG